MATPRAREGDSEVIDGIRYVLRNEEQLRALIRDNKWSDVEKTCTSRIKSFHRLFHNKKNFNGKIAHWDTSSVTNMDSTFFNAYKFNQPIQAWNTRNVKTMRWMFSFATSFNQPIGRWDTHQVTDMNHMFYNAWEFNQDISLWDTRRVTDMSSMFGAAYKFNQRLSTWNVGNVRSMYEMFAWAKAFNQRISNWDVRKVKDLRWMFREAVAFEQDISPWIRRLQGIKIDDKTYLRLRVGQLSHDIEAFKHQKHRLHNEADAINYIIGMNTKIPLNDARVIAGDLHNGRIRHIWHKNALEGMMNYGHGPIFEHPLTRQLYIRDSVVPLRDVLHENDVNLYNRLRNGRTVRETRNRRR